MMFDTYYDQNNASNCSSMEGTSSEFPPHQRHRANTWPKPVLDTNVTGFGGFQQDKEQSAPVCDSAYGSQQQLILEEGIEGGEGSGEGGQFRGEKILSSSRRPNPWGNQSYADLITEAINSTQDKRLTLSQIYDWMIHNVQYFGERSDSKASSGWKVQASANEPKVQVHTKFLCFRYSYFEKSEAGNPKGLSSKVGESFRGADVETLLGSNSVRHNLSLHNKFVRIHNDGPGKSSWWILNPESKTINKPLRRRAGSMEQAKALERQKLVILPRGQFRRGRVGTSIEVCPLSSVEAAFRSRTSSNVSTMSESSYRNLRSPLPGETMLLQAGTMMGSGQGSSSMGTCPQEMGQGHQPDMTLVAQAMFPDVVAENISMSLSLNDVNSILGSSGQHAMVTGHSGTASVLYTVSENADQFDQFSDVPKISDPLTDDGGVQQSGPSSCVVDQQQIIIPTSAPVPVKQEPVLLWTNEGCRATGHQLPSQFPDVKQEQIWLSTTYIDQQHQQVQPMSTDQPESQQPITVAYFTGQSQHTRSVNQSQSIVFDQHQHEQLQFITTNTNGAALQRQCSAEPITATVGGVVLNQPINIPANNDCANQILMTSFENRQQPQQMFNDPVKFEFPPELVVVEQQSSHGQQLLQNAFTPSASAAVEVYSGHRHQQQNCAQQQTLNYYSASVQHTDAAQHQGLTTNFHNTVPEQQMQESPQTGFTSFSSQDIPPQSQHQQQCINSNVGVAVGGCQPPPLTRRPQQSTLVEILSQASPFRFVTTTTSQSALEYRHQHDHVMSDSTNHSEAPQIAYVPELQQQSQNQPIIDFQSTKPAPQQQLMAQYPSTNEPTYSVGYTTDNHAEVANVQIQPLQMSQVSNSDEVSRLNTAAADDSESPFDAGGNFGSINL